MLIQNTYSPKAVYLLSLSAYDLIYGPEERSDIARLAKMQYPVLTAETWKDHLDVCRHVEVIFSGWGMPKADPAFLDAFPNLKAVFYGAGSIKGFATEAFWNREIIASSAAAANAVPVCEFTVAQIVLSSKHAWRFASHARSMPSIPTSLELESPGMYESTVGLISLGVIGRMVAERLRQFQVKVIAYDPIIDPCEAAQLNVQLCPLEEVFQKSDVVSCHAPLLNETEGMLTQELFESMKRGATFINTARGAVVDESGLIIALQKRPDLWALLDVTKTEPPEPGSPLYLLPNVTLTPHIAGSMGKECHRLGRTMVEEFTRYLAGHPLKHAVSPQEIACMA